MLSLNNNIYYSHYKAIVYLNPPKENPQVKIQPNPASNQIDVHLLNYTSKRICQLEISDSKGSIRKRELLNCNVEKHKIDISELTPGVYWITVVSEKITSVTKLIVLR